MEEIPVKVAVRIRPLLPKEILHNQQVCVRVVPNTQQVIMGKDRAFTFDFVFGQKSLQNELYVTCIKPLVLSLIEGYNVTVFAYGQTGSGKTYTIGGGHVVSSSDEEKGIIPRAIQEIFHCISENHNRDFTVKVSYIEVYKEELRDLLELETSFKDMHIREDEKGNTVIVGAKESLVETADEVISLLESGNAARHTGTTQMNKHSSRSHTIFTITVGQKGPKSEADQLHDGPCDSFQLISSKFHFVDLAGSERAAKTGNTGERFKESIQINSGLLALGNVISALGDPKRKSLHVPYRDAKITRILKDSLGGNTKTVMITCISPSSLNFDESLNSLKYANRAKNIKNKPIVNYNPDLDRMDEMELEIRALREALQNQRASLMTRASRVSQDLPGGHDKTRIHAMEGQLAQLQVECYQYRACTENAFQFLLELKGMASLPKIHKRKLQEWLDTAEELQRENPSTSEADSEVGSAGEEPHHITILQLKRELKKCQDALTTDEEVFIQKEAEVKELQAQIKSLLQENEEHLAALEDEESKRRIQNEKMVEQQLIIDQLREGLLNIKQSKSCVCVNGAGDAAASVTSSKRPYSVPLGNKHQPDSLQNTPMPDTRKVHTSPPAYSLERVMAAFRTRSQMLLAQIEEQDEVLCHEISDSSEEEEKDDEKKKEGKLSFRHSMNRTWTRRQTPLVTEPNLCDLFINHKKNNVQSENDPETKHTTGDELEAALAEEASLRQSQTLNLHNLKDAELRLTQAKQKTKELAINIRMKEELIKELVKTGKDAQEVNRHYSMKIAHLEQEADQAKKELAETQKQLQELESREVQDGTEIARLQREFRKKVDTAKLKVQVLQKKQQDTKKLASLSSQSEKRLTELEQNVDHMKRQQTQLHKKLREEAEKKKKLEAEIYRDQQRIKDLQLKTEQQQKILKLKTEEIAAFKRMKRAVSSPDEQQRLERQRKWLDDEVEKVLQQRQTLAELENELKKREEIIAKKEALSQGMSQLEIKKLRSSQALNKDILKLSTRLSVVDKELSDKNNQFQGSSAENKKRISKEVEVLQQERSQLLKRRDCLDDKLRNGRVLTAEEEHILFQLEEGIEALDAAIDFKNDTIDSQQHSVRDSTEMLTSSEAGIMVKLSTLSFSEIKALLFRYFNKVVCLRESERTLQLQCEEMGIQMKEEERIIHELESALERLTLEMDRRLTLQQKEHEQKMQLILQGFKEQGSDGLAENINIYEAKVRQLEKDLFFYKKTSRELKKKLKEIVANSLNQQSASTKGIGDDQEKIVSISEEDKWVTKFESNKANANSQKDSASFPTSARAQNSRIWDEIAEIAQTPTSASRKHLASYEEQSAGDEAPYSITALSSVPQTGDSAAQLPGVTPVRVSRRELRRISASELSNRRSSLGAIVTSIPEDSIEIS
ncbi:kinesin-like protein KIF27 isoform X1 [Acipenser oxyrinchus oxyrinchus]|uniref:Kinesin-like protein KIF27 isoform X1 n=1 Tax=Acipenser oxyrinchus oxyrinchus TaxID=40147 RepID=A0AAD8GIB7_ACIOX|nr:kinesin-like protein KIF27 isoform X1 [Acipenser oxyrinchus oxyrinchus]